MIKPTVGRLVLYRHPSTKNINNINQTMHPSVVCYVHDEGKINLSVLGSEGQQYAQEAVTLFQGEAKDCPPGQCCWMDYQRKVTTSQKES